jgi:hypothetical protein
VAVTGIDSNRATPPRVVGKAVSAASRPEQMRTSERSGASRVASTTCQVPSTSAPTTAWKSMGSSPDA